MRTRIVAGGELDVATPEETRAIVHDIVSDHTAKLARLWDGPTYLPVRASAVHLDPGAAAEIAGPRAGFVWSLLRISVVGSPVSVHIGDAAASTYVDTVGGEPGGCATFGPGAVIVPPGSVVVVRNPHEHAVLTHVNFGVAVVPVERQGRL